MTSAFRRAGRVSRVLRTASLAAAFGATLSAVARPIVAQGAPDARPTLAVLYLTNGAMVDNASYAPLSKGMAEMLITELAQNGAVRVVERDRIQTLLEEQNLQGGDRVDKATAVKLGKILGARHMLMGSFVVDPRQNMRIDVRAVNTETSAIDYVQTVSGKADQLLDLVIQLGAKVNAGLKLPALKTASATIPAAKHPNQFKALMAMSQALEAQDSKNLDQARTLYQTAIALNPDMSRARVLLASVENGR
jgi:curli biogenesis system outer membrane secretion channel CsgG